MDTVRRYNRLTGDWETWPQVRCPHRRIQKNGKPDPCGELYGLSLAKDIDPTHYECNRCHRKYSARDVKIFKRHEARGPALTVVPRSDRSEQLELPMEGEI